MINLNILNMLKYRIVRIIESNPSINLLIYNNIRFFKFLLPHEKDYLGMKKICTNRNDFFIIDVGANLGISSLGFRAMGFKNKIIIFEPNKEIYRKFLIKLSQKDNQIKLNNIALGHRNGNKNFYLPYINKKSIHYFGTFDKKYLINSLKLTFPNLLQKIKIRKNKIKILKYDSLNIKGKPHFIKIDVEGYDHFVLRGFEKTIKRHKPIFLVEYNKENYYRIVKILKDYESFFYDIKTDKLIKLKKKYLNNKIARTNKKNLLSIRNIYFIPK